MEFLTPMMLRPMDIELEDIFLQLTEGENAAGQQEEEPAAADQEQEEETKE